MSLIFFQIFAKYSREQEKMYSSVTRIRITRNNSGPNDEMKFTYCYSTAFSCLFVFWPQEFNLKSNTECEFKYFVRDAQQVALVDSNQKWYHLTQSPDELNIWMTKQTFSAKGNLRLYAKFGQSNSFSGLCNYNLI